MNKKQKYNNIILLNK